MKTFQFCKGDFMHCSGCVIADDKQNALDITNHAIDPMFPDMPKRLTVDDFIEVEPYTSVIVKHFI